MTDRRDPIREGLARGWRVIDARDIDHDPTYEADVAIVGTGAGGATVADILSAAGLRIILIEEGPLKSSSDFRMRESEAYPDLYQASAARKTRDKAINILQGRCVGGGTTVNWTSSFRTPPRTLAHWRDALGIEGYGTDDLAAWFARAEARLSIAPWTVAPNANNAALARGARALGIAHGTIRRNVSGCLNLGYCGMGCPTNAKQSMLVTTIPAALDQGALLLTRTRAQRLAWSGDRASSLECVALDRAGIAPGARRIHVRARTYVAAGGAINTPALLLRSGVPDPHGVVGRRTFLHPTVVSAALMPDACTPMPSSTTCHSKGPSATRSKRRPSIPSSPPSRCRGTARRMRASCASCRTCRCSSRCCATASMMKVPAAPCTSPSTARRCSTIRCASTCGTVCAARSPRWPTSSSPRVHAPSCRCMRTARRTSMRHARGPRSPASPSDRS
jgi:hypothetical protein